VRNFVVNTNDDPQKILEEEAKALAQFNKVCVIKTNFLRISK
jgi:hypothetical protein